MGPTVSVASLALVLSATRRRAGPGEIVNVEPDPVAMDADAEPAEGVSWDAEAGGLRMESGSTASWHIHMEKEGLYQLRLPNDDICAALQQIAESPEE